MERYDLFVDDGEGTIKYEKSYVKTVDGDYAAIYDDSVTITRTDKLMMTLLRNRTN